MGAVALPRNRIIVASSAGVKAARHPKAVEDHNTTRRYRASDSVMSRAPASCNARGPPPLWEKISISHTGRNSHRTVLESEIRGQVRSQSGDWERAHVGEVQVSSASGGVPCRIIRRGNYTPEHRANFRLRSRSGFQPLSLGTKRQGCRFYYPARPSPQTKFQVRKVLRFATANGRK